MFYSLPISPIVDREQYLVSLCAEKDVVHLGAAQANDSNDLETYGTTIDPTTFLHSRISAVARHCIGIDYNKKSIDLLRSVYGINDIYLGNIEDKDSLDCIKFSPDIILMGEILEHLPNPGLALSNIKNKLMS